MNYHTTTTRCACPSRTYRPGVDCKHMKAVKDRQDWLNDLVKFESDPDQYFQELYIQVAELINLGIVSTVEDIDKMISVFKNHDDYLNIRYKLNVTLSDAMRG